VLHSTPKPPVQLPSADANTKLARAAYILHTVITTYSSKQHTL
jgi:hypothetical protein